MQLIKDSEKEDFIKRMEHKKVAVRKDKTNLINAAKEYEGKYEKVINEGTEKRKLLIEDGKRRGLTEEQVVGTLQKFIPSRSTPILNMLYFLMYEYKDITNDIQFLREDKDVGRDFEDLQKMLNENYGGLTEKDVDQNIPDVLEYVYDKVTLDIFNTVKKLKSLCESSNENEAARAFIKCRDLCKKYNLDFSRIPSLPPPIK